jgi:type II secretory pathway component PulJ
MRRLPGAPRHARRRGDTIVEALVATVLLTVAALALLGLTAVLLRDERRGATRVRGAALLEARTAEWHAAPCGGAGGTRVVDGLHERWTVAYDADSLEVLRDSVLAPDDPGQGSLAVAARAGVRAVSRGPRPRRGSTLATLLVGLGIASVVGASLGGVTVALLRAAHRSHARRAARAQLSYGAAVLAWELRDLGHPPHRDRRRRPAARDRLGARRAGAIGGGVACAVGPSAVELHALVVPGAPPTAWWGDAPEAGDVVHLHDEGPTASWRDDAWHARTVDAVDVTGAACATGPLARGAPAPHYRLRLGGAPLPPTVAAGAPVRVSRLRRYLHYRDADGRWQLGQRPLAAGVGPVQPVAGPLAAPGGWPGITVAFAEPRLAVTLRAEIGAGPARWRDSLSVHAALDAQGAP